MQQMNYNYEFTQFASSPIDFAVIFGDVSDSEPVVFMCFFPQQRDAFDNED